MFSFLEQLHEDLEKVTQEEIDHFGTLVLLEGRSDDVFVDELPLKLRKLFIVVNNYKKAIIQMLHAMPKCPQGSCDGSCLEAVRIAPCLRKRIEKLNNLFDLFLEKEYPISNRRLLVISRGWKLVWNPTDQAKFEDCLGLGWTIPRLCECAREGEDSMMFPN